MTDPNNPVLVPDLARPLLRRLTDPTPNAGAKIYSPDGTLIADSRVRQGAGGAVSTEPLPSVAEPGPVIGLVGRIYDAVLAWMPHTRAATVEISPNAAGADWQPDVREELRLTSSNDSHEMPPYIRRTQENQLLVTVTEPVERDRHTVGIVLLTRDAVEVDNSLFAVRISILGLFVGALLLTVLLSWYLSLTLARPILRLADSAQDMREGHGRTGGVPPELLRRRDEIGALGQALSASATALWGRMDAIERFAADVAHEIKNPLSSIRSAIDTLRRVTDPAAQARLLAIIQDDVVRLDRLISDISDASRVDAELSRTATELVDVVPMISALGEIAEATRDEGDATVVVEVPQGDLTVQAVEGRLVQVLRNLIGNAKSFSPPGGRIFSACARDRRDGGDRGRGRGAGHTRRQSGACVRAILLRASGRRKFWQAFRVGAVDQPADRRGAARPDQRREPPGFGGPGDGGALRGAAATRGCVNNSLFLKVGMGS